MMSADENRIERRCGQRFPYQNPVQLRVSADGRSGSGFTQNLSSRGAMIRTDLLLAEGEVVEMTLLMPSEITLAEDMNVCCRTRVLRHEEGESGKSAVALRIEHYDFLHGALPAIEVHSAREVPLVRP